MYYMRKIKRFRLNNVRGVTFHSNPVCEAYNKMQGNPVHEAYNEVPKKVRLLTTLDYGGGDLPIYKFS